MLSSLSAEANASDTEVPHVQLFSVESPQGLLVTKTMGLVFGVSSKQAFWGLSTQADRISRAFEVAQLDLKIQAEKLGANCVVGIQASLNNSAGSSASLIAGSSEGVLLIGTACLASTTGLHSDRN